MHQNTMRPLKNANFIFLFDFRAKFSSEKAFENKLILIHVHSIGATTVGDFIRIITAL